MINNRIIIAVTVVLSLAGSVLHGQEKILVRGAIFPAGQDENLELLLADGISGMPVTLWDGDLSPETELPRMPVWRFGVWKEGPDASGASDRIFVERGRVTPGQSRRQWLLLFPTGNSSTPMTVKCFPADDSSIREGGVLILNLTTQPIAGIIKKERFSLKAGANTVVNPGTTRGEQYPIQFAYPFEGKPRIFAESAWFHGERRRRIALVVQKKEKSYPELFTMTDMTALPKPAAP